MYGHRYDVLQRTLTRIPSRRDVVRALAAAGFGAAPLPLLAEARRRAEKENGKGTARSKQDLCRKNGSKCRNPSKKCKKAFCLNAPFTVEATWTKDADHDSFLFVPPKNQTTGPAPYIDYYCNPIDSGCTGETYPFACVSEDERTSGSEITTIHRLLPGRYEYWNEIYYTTPAGQLTITLKDNGGRVVRKWTNPANDSSDFSLGWHVFDIDGVTGRVTAIDKLTASSMPEIAHDPNTNVCPDPSGQRRGNAIKRKTRGGAPVASVN